MTGKGRAGRVAPYAVVGAAAGYLYYVATHIQYAARAGTLGPDFWPKLVLTLIIITCLYEVVKIVVLRRPDVEGLLREVVEKAGGEGFAGPMPHAGERRPWLLLTAIALTGAYVALVQTLGFFTATVPYLAAFTVLGGYRRWGVVAAVSIAGTVLMVFFFMKVVYVSLPLGTGPFQHVTLLLMQLLGIR